jgi:glycerophosphoryl diester phosphodiesterase
MSRTTIEAHRGYSAAYPENTLLSFRQAVAAGAPSIELDIHVSADGELVVMHDATVDRTTDGAGEIASLPWPELRRLDAGAWKAPAFAGERIPLLSEALSLSDAHPVAFNVEVKRFRDSGQAAGKLAELLRRHRPRQGEHVVSSFDLDALLQVHAADASVPLGILGRDGVALLALAREHGFPWVHVQSEGVTGDLVAAAHAHGVRVMVWTVDDQAAVRHFAGLGVDKVCTNRAPEMLAACL